MTTAVNTLWQSLFKADLVPEDRPEKIAMNSPWYVKALLAISGWLGAFFILGFIFALFSSLFSSLFDEPSVAFFLSLPLFISAYFILVIPKNEFYEHLALAMSLAGQALFFLSATELQYVPLVWFMVALLQMTLAYLMPSFLHKVFSTLFAALALEVTLAALDAPFILGSLLIFPTVWLCLHEFRFVNHYKRVSGLMYGLVVSVLLLNSNHLFGLNLLNLLSSTNESGLVVPYWLTDLIFIATSLFSAWQLLCVYHVKTSSRLSVTVILFSLILAVMTLKAPGIMVGLIVILLGFAQSNRLMLGLGIISLLFYSSSYYYMMAETLLFKSVVLFAIAVFMLICRITLARFSPLLKEE